MRKYIIAIIGLVALVAIIGLVTAGYDGLGNGESPRESFIDEDGDGVCDNWVDVDGDGVNDNCLSDGLGNQYRNCGEQGKRNGFIDGSGRNCIGPRDGSGFVPYNVNCE